MALPTVAVQFGFGQSIGTAKGSVAWTDVTDYVRLAAGMSFGRGRTAVGQAPSAGTLSLALANNDGRFTPSTSMLASDGAYSDDYFGTDDYDTSPGVRRVQTRIPVRIQAYVDPFDADFDADFGQIIDLWYGFVTDVDWNPGADVTAKFQAADILAQAGKVKLRGWLTGRNLAQSPAYYWPLTDPAGDVEATSGLPAPPPWDGIGDPVIDDRPPLVVACDPASTATITFGVESDASPDAAETTVAITPDGALPKRLTATVLASGLQAGFSLWFLPVGTQTYGELVSLRYWGLLPPGVTDDSQWPMLVSLAGGSNPGTVGQIMVSEGGQYALFGGASTVTADAWNHLYVIRDSTQIDWGTRYRVWINGAPVAFASSPGGALPATFDLADVSYGAQLDRMFSGQLAHAAIFRDDVDRAAFLADNGTRSTVAATRFTDLAQSTAQPAAIASWMDADATADVPISAQPSRGVSLIDVGQQIATTERGSLIATRGGLLRLVSSRSRLTETVALTLDARTDVLSFDGAFAIDDADAVDEVTVTAQPTGASYTGTRTGGVSMESTTQDVWSSDRVHAQAVADGIANYPVDIPKSPRLSVSMEWMTYTGYTEEVLSLELGDLIRVTNLPLSAPSSTVDLVVEAIDHQVGTNDWIITFDTSPGELAAGGVVGTSGTLSTVATTLTVRP